MDEENQIPFAYDDDPCATCDNDCDGWDAQFCCLRCQYFGQEDCDNCDPMDI